ncbi:hypothetical protein [Komagataeibacter xylinus]|uniref:hypothetical protein n=1 Tax=Komagataeibacter xylinus TaxID=28448 RepID=UPI00280AD86E|nr:hypothetical protein [Komagataeibacter xylinus]
MPFPYNGAEFPAMKPSPPKPEFQDWLILVEDGRHVLLGRHSPPTDEEISRAAHALAAQGIGGWLAKGSGHYYQKRQQYSLLKIRPFTKISIPWEVAETRFHHIRKEQ